jgi:hypothetical protein
VIGDFDLNDIVDNPESYRYSFPIDGHSEIIMHIPNVMNCGQEPDRYSFFGIRGLIELDAIKRFVHDDFSHFDVVQTTLRAVYGNEDKGLCVGFLFGQVIDDIMKAGNKIKPITQ